MLYYDRIHIPEGIFIIRQVHQESAFITTIGSF